MRLIGLVVVLAVGVLVPLAGETQPQMGKVYRIGFLRAGPPPTAWVEAFQRQQIVAVSGDTGGEGP
jgi:hypothetical protein